MIENFRISKRVVGSASVAAVLLAATLLLPARLFAQAQIFEIPQGLPDLDTRTAWVQPTQQQLATVSNLGATARWNHFGTPQSLINYGSYLATGLTGQPATAARNWLNANAALFRLSQGANGLDLLADNQMAQSAGHAVTFRQRFGGLPATLDGMITVGIINGKIAYVSSSAVDDTAAAPGPASLSATNVWLAAATNIGRTVSSTDITSTTVQGDWTVLVVNGFAFPQRVRLVAFPVPNDAVHPAYETIVLDQQGGASTAYKFFIDAQNGSILFRQNAVSQLAQTTAFTGTYNPNQCGPTPQNGPFVMGPNQQTIDVFVNATVITNDIAIFLIFNNNIVGSSDVVTSPEVIHYAPSGGVPVGSYFVEVCQSSSPATPSVSPTTYAGTFTTNDTAPGQFPPYPPEWSVFPANPSLDYSSTDTRQLWCWESVVSGNPVPGCQRTLMNLAARGPWDFDFRSNLPSFTTKGNAANTAEAWLSPLTPAEQNRPVSPSRVYSFTWNNTWFNSKCNPASLTPGGNDILPATVNLFSMHNRMHDWSYFLGFTENNFNLQEDNFGVNAQGEHDPELGDVQAGAISGAPPSNLGRDNANQITLNDGIPGITNQYLFEPLPAAIYVPCVDGDMDMEVVGHEYTHAISHRMIGKAAATISGQQGNSMGESWSDLDALEYLNEFGFVPTMGDNPFAEGVYVTGNKSIGIRNYSLDKNPLNYGDLGYDKTGPEVHADGEIWNAVNFDIRQALVKKYNAQFPATNAALQAQCAEGIPGSNPPTTPLPPNQCPGNRRWIQIMYDAFLLENSGVSMLDARDAYLAADVMRFGGANQKELWHAFAYRGFGKSASTVDSNDTAPVPGFDSPLETPATVTFTAVAIDEGNVPVKAKVFVGDYEARSRPIVADTTSASNTVKLVAGRYHFIAQANGYGMLRFHSLFTGGTSPTITLQMPTNWASVNKGAVASGDGTNLNNLIDDTENTDWTQSGNPVAGTQVVVQLAGGARTVAQAEVSALMGPGEGRFTGLRSFEISTCTASSTNVNCSTPPLGYTAVLTATDAFPAAGIRPLAPDLFLRSFPLATTTATHVRLKVLSNQCTGGEAYNGVSTNDPINLVADCNQAQLLALGQTSNPNITTVRAAELQVFSHFGRAMGAHDPLVTLTMTAPATAALGSTITYSLSYTNAGPAPSQGAQITDVLPWGLNFVSATNGGTYDPTSRTITWNLGTVAVGVTGAAQATVQVDPLAATLLSTIINEAEFSGQLTVSLPTADALTLVLP